MTIGRQTHPSRQSKATDIRMRGLGSNPEDLENREDTPKQFIIYLADAFNPKRLIFRSQRNVEIASVVLSATGSLFHSLGASRAKYL